MRQIQGTPLFKRPFCEGEKEDVLDETAAECLSPRMSILLLSGEAKKGKEETLTSSSSTFQSQLSWKDYRETDNMVSLVEQIVSEGAEWDSHSHPSPNSSIL